MNSSDGETITDREKARSQRNRFVIFTLAGTALLVSLLYLVNHFSDSSLPAFALTVSRWMFMGALLAYAFVKKSLTTAILVSMILGIEVGYDFPIFSQDLKVVSKIFLLLIKTVVAPLLFGTLVVGIAGHSNLGQLGRMGWKSILYFELITTIALFIGLGAINLTQAGVGLEQPTEIAAPEELTKIKDAKKTWQDVVLHVFPENISKAIAEGAILQIVVFSILFGIALLQVKEVYRKPMLDFAESLSEVMFKFTNIIMYLAPAAVGCAMAVTVGQSGLKVLENLLGLVATLYGALAVLLVFVLLPIAWIIGMPVRKFINAISEPVSIAFATTSSEAALPKAMTVMEKMGVPRKIVSFVMPMGYSFNLDGTTLYLALASMFVAQAAGVHLDFGSQVIMMVTLMLTSKGVAAVPRASLIILLGTAASFGLPEWPIYVIFGIDALMDMARTSVNVVGNCLATAVIAKWEGEVKDFKTVPAFQSPESTPV